MREHRSWLELLIFCTVMTSLVALLLGILFAGATLAFAANPTADDNDNSPAPQHFSGMITDSLCGARHSAKFEKTPSECARMCVRNGAQYTLIDGDRRYELRGITDELQRAAGRRATIVGVLQGDTITVSSIGAL